MSKVSEFFKKNKDDFESRTAKIGGYSFIVSVVVLAVLVAVNIAVSALPTTWTQFDISAARLYSVTSSTKVVAQNLDEDVNVYWICQEGKEDQVVEKLLTIYNSLSDHIIVERSNPDIYPTFAAKYTDEQVQNNSIVVVCGDRYRYIPYSSIYEQDVSDYYSSGTVAYNFDGEGQITTAIDYVTSDDLPKLYLLTGHGEATPSEALNKGLNKKNYETEELSLLNIDEIPEDADGILIYAPTSDISDKEAEMLNDYMDNGGHLFVISGLQSDDSMENLHSVAERYGITFEEGIVVEEDRNHFAFSAPYVLLPDLGDSEITSELAENNSYIIAALAQGMSIGDSASSITVTPLLTTSELSFSKAAGYDIQTYEKETGDTDGPFTVALTVEDAEAESNMVWISCDTVAEDMYNAYSSGANIDFVCNALSWTVGEDDSISISSKSMDYNYLTISTTQATMLKFYTIVLIPLVYLLMGVADVIQRKKKA